MNVELELTIRHNVSADLLMKGEMFLIAEESKALKMNVEIDFLENSITLNGSTIGVYQNVLGFERLDIIEVWGNGLMSIQGEVTELKLNGKGILGQNCYRDKEIIDLLNY